MVIDLTGRIHDGTAIFHADRLTLRGRRVRRNLKGSRTFTRFIIEQVHSNDHRTLRGFRQRTIIRESQLCSTPLNDGPVIQTNFFDPDIVIHFSRDNQPALVGLPCIDGNLRRFFIFKSYDLFDCVAELIRRGNLDGL